MATGIAKLNLDRSLYQVLSAGYHYQAEVYTSFVTRSIMFLRSRPHSDVIDRHLLPRDGVGRRSRGSIDRVWICATHCDIHNDVEPMMKGVRPLGGAQLCLRDGVLQLAVKPELELLGRDGPVQNDFVGVEVAGASATSACANVSQTAGLVADTVRVGILMSS